jgi:uncharacterized protein YlxW (UPF0749 family)
MAGSASQVFTAVIKADASGAVTELKKVSGEIDKTTSGAVSKLDKFAGAATKAGIVMVSAAAAGAGAIFKLAQGASNLAESVNAVNVTFGEASEGILELGESAATAVGLSKSEFNGLAVQFSSFAKTVTGDGGDVVATMDTLTTRVADFASVMNLDVPEAARIFQSALAGETEPIKKFGIDLSAASVAAFAVANGISESAASMTEAEKVTARYGLLMESTEQTAGDFANTSDGLANQQRILSANLKNLADGIGTGALPMLTALVSTANKAVMAFADLSPEAQSAIGKFAAMGVAGLGLLGSLSLVAGQVIKMRDRFTTLGDDGVRSLNNMGKAAKGLGVGMGIATLAVVAFELNQKRQNDSLHESLDLMGELSRLAAEELPDAYRDMLVAGLMAGNSLSEVMQKFAESNLEAAMRVRDNAEAMGIATDQQDALIHAINVEIVARKTQAKTTDEYTGAEEAATDATAASVKETFNLKKEMEGGIDVTETAVQAQEALVAQQEAAAESAADQAEALADLTKELIDAVDSIFNLENATLDLNSAYAAYQESVLATTALLQDSEATDREKEQALRDLRSEELATAASALATAQAYAAEKGAAEGSAASAQLQKEKLQELQAQFPELRDEIQEYINKLNAVPGVIKTRFEITATGATVTPHGDFIGIPVGARAGGGPIGPGLTLVGEKGPEILSLGSGVHGNVIPNNQLGAMGATVFNVNVNAGMGADGKEIGDVIVDKIRQYERRNGPGWRT